jgi:hypothetical protein
MNKTIESLQKITRESQIKIKEVEQKEFENFINSDLFTNISHDFEVLAILSAREGAGSAELDLSQYFTFEKGFSTEKTNKLKVLLADRVSKALCKEGYRRMQTTINGNKWTIRMSWFEDDLNTSTREFIYNAVNDAMKDAIKPKGIKAR